MAPWATSHLSGCMDDELIILLGLHHRHLWLQVEVFLAAHNHGAFQHMVTLAEPLLHFAPLHFVLWTLTQTTGSQDYWSAAWSRLDASRPKMQHAEICICIFAGIPLTMQWRMHQARFASRRAMRHEAVLIVKHRHTHTEPCGWCNCNSRAERFSCPDADQAQITSLQSIRLNTHENDCTCRDTAEGGKQVHKKNCVCKDDSP